MATTDFTNGVSLSDASWADDVDCSAYSVLSAVAGTNTITATGPATYSYSATRPPIWFIPANTNTGATTINVTPSGGSSLGAKNVFWNGAACVGGELRQSVPVALIYDGTQFHIVAAAFLSRQVTLGTEQASTSGTSIDFTSIPSWVKNIVVEFVGVSTNGTAEIYLQLGDSGGIEVSGYLGAQVTLANAGAVAGNQNSAGFYVSDQNAASGVLHGNLTLTLEDATQFTWTLSGCLAQSEAISVHCSAGSKSTSAALDRVRITTSNGTDTFDAGAINILYS